MASIFTNYRRRDSTSEAHCMLDRLRSIFGEEAVFIDDSTIQAGDHWPDEINNAISASTVVIIIIGSSWLRIQDEFGQRLLDRPNDWVRREIETAITDKKKILPVLLGDVEMPTAGALPAEIVKLSDHQALRIRQDSWLDDFQKLVARIESAGIRRTANPLPPLIGAGYPACQESYPKLTEEQLTIALKTCPHWTRVAKEGKEYIQREFQFQTFEDAIHFMATGARVLAKLNHHPEWRNTFKVVETWLTTFDSGSRLTAIDFDVAQALDDLFISYRS
jgi:pterin-4a-carbinolamine dehydratase